MNNILDQTLLAELCIATGVVWRVEPLNSGAAFVARVDSVEIAVTGGESLRPPTESDTSFGIAAWTVFSNELIVDDVCICRRKLVSIVAVTVASLTRPPTSA